jgi:hypothetical protein
LDSLGRSSGCCVVLEMTGISHKKAQKTQKETPCAFCASLRLQNRTWT